MSRLGRLAALTGVAAIALWIGSRPARGGSSF